MKRINLKQIEPIISRLLNISAQELDSHFFPAQEKHIDEIVNMRQRILPEQTSAEDKKYLEWRYNFGPYLSKEEALNENRMWVFAIDNEVLAVVGVQAINICAANRVIPSLTTMDLIAKAEHEGKGLGVWINLKIQDSGRPILAMGSNKNSVGIVSKLFQRMPHRKVYRNILSSPKYFAKKTNNIFLGNALAKIYKIYIGIRLRLLSSGLNSNYSIKKLSSFSECHSDFVADLNMEDVFIQRNTSTLNWRLFDYPRESVDTYGIHLDNQIVAYISIAISNSTKESTATILDWGCRKDLLDLKNFSRILSKIQWGLLKANIADVTAYGYDNYSDQLFRRAGIGYRNDESKTLSLFCADENTFKVLSNGEQWFLTGFDADDV